MRYKIVAALVGLLLVSAITTEAQIFYANRVDIPFAPTKVPKEVAWSSSVSLKDDGLYSEKLPSNMSREVWVQSQPIPAGNSWRPPTTATINLQVKAGAKDFTYLHAYFRYSCDRVHWSTWYNLRPVTPETNAGTVYEGGLSIPRMAHAPYYEKMNEWWQTKPNWYSDEHELCVWITRQDPDFFAREFPFIGYVQVRIEGETQGLHLKSMSVKVDAAVSGLYSPDKGQGRVTTDEPWSFDVSKVRP
jgi:hypothetical protein